MYVFCIRLQTPEPPHPPTTTATGVPRRPTTPPRRTTSKRRDTRPALLRPRRRTTAKAKEDRPRCPAINRLLRTPNQELPAKCRSTILDSNTGRSSPATRSPLSTPRPFPRVGSLVDTFEKLSIYCEKQNRTLMKITDYYDCLFIMTHIIIYYHYLPSSRCHNQRHSHLLQLRRGTVQCHHHVRRAADGKGVQRRCPRDPCPFVVQETHDWGRRWPLWWWWW